MATFWVYSDGRCLEIGSGQQIPVEDPGLRELLMKRAWPSRAKKRKR